MIRIDEKFLEAAGLAEMPADQKPVFMDYVQEELEVRVGEKLAEGLSEEVLKEFEGIIHMPESEEQQRLSAEWIQKNRPDHTEIIKNTLEELRQELFNNRERLIGAYLP